MSGPGLLRRAAAATIGADLRRLPATTVMAPRLPLARRAAAALIGIRTRPATARTPHRSGDHCPAPVRVWEVRRPHRPATSTPAPDEDNAARHAFLPPSPWRRTPPTPNTQAADSPIVIVAAGGDDISPRPRTWLAVAATAAVLATALGVSVYHHTSTVRPQPPSRGVVGDVPRPFVGTWTTTITNADGDNTRTLVIEQGSVGDTVMTLTADGPTSTGTYHCVFTAPLSAATPTDIQLGASTVTAGDPGYCKPGGATTLTLKEDGALKRTTDSNGETLTYTRTTPP